MNSKTLLPLLAALIFLCGAARLPLTSWLAGVDGVGPIRLGMSLDEARRASGMDFVEQPNAGEVTNWDVCHYAWLSAQGQLRLDLALVLHQGRVARIEVLAPEVATASGVRVGDSEARVRAFYAGRLSDGVAPGAAHMRLLVVGTRAATLRFLIQDAKVLAFHVGQAAASLPGGTCA